MMSLIYDTTLDAEVPLITPFWT